MRRFPGEPYVPIAGGLLGLSLVLFSGTVWPGLALLWLCGARMGYVLWQPPTPASAERRWYVMEYDENMCAWLVDVEHKRRMPLEHGMRLALNLLEDIAPPGTPHTKEVPYAVV